MSTSFQQFLFKYLCLKCEDRPWHSRYDVMPQCCCHNAAATYDLFLMDKTAPIPVLLCVFRKGSMWPILQVILVGVLQKMFKMFSENVLNVSENALNIYHNDLNVSRKCS